MSDLDLEYLFKLDSWTVEEGIAIIYGRDPRHFDTQYVRSSPAAEHTPMHDAFRLAGRHPTLMLYSAGGFLPPGEFLSWAESKELPLSEPLRKHLDEWKEKHRAKPAEKEQSKTHGNTVRNAERREQVLGVATAVALNWTGKDLTATNLAKNVVLRWPDSLGEPPMAERTIADLIRSYRQHFDLAE